jgi:hypothetical protein
MVPATPAIVSAIIASSSSATTITPIARWISSEKSWWTGSSVCSMPNQRSSQWHTISSPSPGKKYLRFIPLPHSNCPLCRTTACQSPDGPSCGTCRDRGQHDCNPGTVSCHRSCPRLCDVVLYHSTSGPCIVSLGEGKNHLSSPPLVRELSCVRRSHRKIKSATIAHSLDEVGLSMYSRFASSIRFRSRWILTLGLSLCQGLDLLVKHLAPPAPVDMGSVQHWHLHCSIH